MKGIGGGYGSEVTKLKAKRDILKNAAASLAIESL